MPTFWIHETAVVVGDVSLGADVSVWPTAIIRADVDRIVIGAGSNVQDGAVIHCDAGVPTIIGRDCVIGHRAIVHGAVLEDGVLVGMGAIVLNRAHIGRGAIIGAGAVVTEGMQVPAGALMMGVPARLRRTLDAAEQDATRDNARHYAALKEEYRAASVPRIR